MLLRFLPTSPALSGLTVAPWPRPEWHRPALRPPASQSRRLPGAAPQSAVAAAW